MKHVSGIYQGVTAAVIAALLYGPCMAAPAPDMNASAGPSTAAGDVAPPPRPVGSQLVKHDTVGEAPDVTARNLRAHHDKAHVKKDKTHDDTLDAPDQQKKGGKDD